MAFLTADEIHTLTKRKQGAAQVRVLTRQGIAFKLDGNGHPVVTWESVNAHSGRIPKHRGINHEALSALMDQCGKATRNRARTPQERMPVPRGVAVRPKGR